jgi:hypothetical protein
MAESDELHDEGWMIARRSLQSELNTFVTWPVRRDRAMT